MESRRFVPGQLLQRQNGQNVEKGIGNVALVILAEKQQIALVHLSEDQRFDFREALFSER